MNRLWSHARFTGVQLKSVAKLSTVTGLITKHADCRMKFELCCPSRVITMVRQFHDGMHVSVPNDGEFSLLFPVTRRVTWAVL